MVIEPQAGFSTAGDYLTIFHRYIFRSLEAIYAGFFQGAGQAEEVRHAA